jgi:hypothetical protein
MHHYLHLEDRFSNPNAKATLYRKLEAHLPKTKAISLQMLLNRLYLML